MSDEQNSGTETPPATAGGAFDWLRESHQQSAPMAPLTDDFLAPLPAPLPFGLPDPAMRPAEAVAFPDLLAAPAAPAVPVASIFAPPAAPVPAAAPAVPPPAVSPATTAPPPAAAAAVSPSPLAPVVMPSVAPQSEALEQSAPAFAAPVWSPPTAPPDPPRVETPVAQPVAQPQIVPQQIVPQPVAPARPAPESELPVAVAPDPMLTVAMPTTPMPTMPMPATPMPTTPMPATPMPSAPAQSAYAPAAPAAGPTVQAGTFSFAAEPLAPAPFAGGLGPSALGLERHGGGARSGNGPLDWVAFVLAFLTPPLGLLVGIGAVVSGSRSKGYAAGIAKAAIGIGAALTIVLAAAFVVVTKLNSDAAAHAAIVASSRAYCSKLRSNPATLSSDTFGWPSPGNTIPESISAMKSYETTWEDLAKLAPSGIQSDTRKVAATAESIVAAVQSSQTLNDAGNVAQLHNVVATSGIHEWVSNYCS